VESCDFELLISVKYVLHEETLHFFDVFLELAHQNWPEKLLVYFRPFIVFSL